MRNSRAAMVFWSWVTTVIGVSVGELLPGGSAPLRVLASTGLSDKVLHFCAYLLLSVIPVAGFERRKGILAALSMIPLGIILDSAQSVIPGRSFEAADVAANALGVTMGIAVGTAAVRLRNP